MESNSVKQTALYPRHVALGAKMVPFGGYAMPVQYAGIQAEHHAVRSSVGVFDVSHMGEFRISGPAALTFLQDVTINDVSHLNVGAAQYSAMCYSDGGIVDDLVLYRRDDHFLMVVNAANCEKDFDWLRSNVTGDVTLTNVSDELALIAVQGPGSRKLVGRVLQLDLAGLPFYHFTTGANQDSEVLISRTGYSGELGFELYCDPECALRIWDDLLSAGEADQAVPAGLGARDTLRLEMAYRLYGSDISDESNPLEAGLGWITKLSKGPFIGSKALARLKEQGLSRRLVSFVMDERAIPRPGYRLLVDGEPVGVVTSGTQSPTLKRGIGMGYVGRSHTKPGTSLMVDIRGKSAPATVAKPPLIGPTSLMA